MTEYLSGDFSGNGKVDQADIDLVLLHWGSEAPEGGSLPRWLGPAPSGQVGQGELNDVFQNYGFALSREIVVPQAFNQITLNESGTQFTFDVALSSRPTSDVTLTVSVGDPTELSASTDSLVFTPSNWDVQQQVQVEALADSEIDGNQTTHVRFAVNPLASDPSFHDATDVLVDVVVEDQAVSVAAVTEHAEVSYVLIENSPRVERYDIASETWLSPVALTNAPGPATKLHVDDEGIYVAFGKSVYRYNLDGSNPVHLINTEHAVRAIHSDGNLLFINQSSGLYARFISIDKTDNLILDTFSNYVDSVYGSSIATDINFIFGRSSGISPADITFVSYADDGTFISGGDSPYHGAYPSASQTWVFPDGAKVVDGSGTIYSTSGLTRLNSFGTQVDDIDFLGQDIPIVLNDNTLTSFTSGILPAGSYTLGYTPSDIFVNDENVVTFTYDVNSPTGVQVRLVSLAELSPPTPGQPVDPVGLPYTPDQVEQAADGTVLLYSKSHQSIFRWDPDTQSYGQTIPLIGTASYMTYSSETNTAYLAYESGLIRKIDMDAAEPTEEPFAVLPSRPLGLSTAGSYVFAVDPSGAWVSHYTFASDGTLVDSEEWNYSSKEFVWSEVNQKMYFFRDGTSPNDLLWEEINADGSTYPGLAPGAIGAKRDSPLHSSAGFTHPIRVAPDGSVVVLGSGSIHDATTLARLPQALSNGFTDADWLNENLYTIRTIAGVTQIQQWNGDNYQWQQAVQTAGTAHTLQAVDENRLLSITLDDEGIPELTLLSSALEKIPNASTLAGDLDGSGYVDQSDLDIVLLYWGNSAPGNFNGAIGQGELDSVLLNWGQSV
ncbi:MAG: hypothetical protein AAF333_06715 [Planctomycetota bacterium]